MYYDIRIVQSMQAKSEQLRTMTVYFLNSQKVFYTLTFTFNRTTEFKQVNIYKTAFYEAIKVLVLRRDTCRWALATYPETLTRGS